MRTSLVGVCRECVPSGEVAGCSGYDSGMAAQVKRQIRFSSDVETYSSGGVSRLPPLPPVRQSLHSELSTSAHKAFRSAPPPRAGGSSAPVSILSRRATSSSSGGLSNGGSVHFAQAIRTQVVVFPSRRYGGSSSVTRGTQEEEEEEEGARALFGPNEIFREFGLSIFLHLISYFYLDELPLLSIVSHGFYKLLVSRRLPPPGPPLRQERRGFDEERKRWRGGDAEEDEERRRSLQGSGKDGDEAHIEGGGRGGRVEVNDLDQDLGRDQQLMEEYCNHSLRVTDRLLRHLLLRECIRTRRRDEAAEQKRLIALSKQLPSRAWEEMRRSGTAAHGAMNGGAAVPTRCSTYRGKRMESDDEASFEEEKQQDGDEKEDSGEGSILGLGSNDVQRIYEVGASCVRDGLRSALSLLPASSTLLSLPTASSVFSATQQQQQQQQQEQQHQQHQQQHQRHQHQLSDIQEHLPEEELRQQQEELNQQRHELQQQQQQLYQQRQKLQQQQLELKRQHSLYLADELLQARQHTLSYVHPLHSQTLPQSRVYFPGDGQPQQKYQVYLPGEEQLELQHASSGQHQHTYYERPHRGSLLEGPPHRMSTSYGTVPHQPLEEEEALLGYSVIERILWQMGERHARLRLRQVIIDCTNAYTAFPRLLQRALLQQAPGIRVIHVHRCEEEKLKVLLTHTLQRAQELQEAALQLESGWTRQEATELLAVVLSGRGPSGGRARSWRSSSKSSYDGSWSGSSSSGGSPHWSGSLSSFCSNGSNEASALYGPAGSRRRYFSSGSQLWKLHVAGDWSLLLAAAHLAQDALRKEAMQQKDRMTRRSLSRSSALESVRYLNISHIQPVQDSVTQSLDIIKQLHVQFPYAQLGLDSVVVVEKAPPAFLGSPGTFSAAAAASGARAAAAPEKEHRWWQPSSWKRRRNTKLPPGKPVSAATETGVTAAAPPPRAPTVRALRKGDSPGRLRTAVSGGGAGARPKAAAAVRATTAADKTVSKKSTVSAAKTLSSRDSELWPETTMSLSQFTYSPANTLARRTSVLGSLRKILTLREEAPSFGSEQHVLSVLLRPASGSRVALAEDSLTFLHASQVAACELITSGREGDTLRCLFSSLQQEVLQSYRDELHLVCRKCDSCGDEAGGGETWSCFLPSVGVQGSPRWLASSEGQRHLQELHMLLEQTRHYVLLLPLDFTAAVETALQQRVGALKPYRHKLVGLELRVSADGDAPLTRQRGVVDMVARSLFAGEPAAQKKKLRLLRVRAPADAAVLAGLTNDVASLVRDMPSLRVVEIATPCVAPSRDRWFLENRDGAVGKEFRTLLRTLGDCGFFCCRRLSTPWLRVTILKRRSQEGEDGQGPEDMCSSYSTLASKRISQIFADT